MSKEKSSETFSENRAFMTLIKKEILRFLSVAPQTLAAPVVTATLYLLIFGVSLGERIALDGNFSYLEFVIPGLILMGAINNSFANCSSSLFLSKYIGQVVELLVIPVSSLRFVSAYVLGAIVRGFLVSLLVFAVSLIFNFKMVTHPFLAIYVLFMTSMMFGSFGFIAAMLSKSFDSLSMFTNFIIVPLIYLGGLFYPIDSLKGVWLTISKMNPMYYLIDLFRYTFIDSSENSFLLGMAVTTLMAFAVFFAAVFFMHKGYKIRS